MELGALVCTPRRPACLPCPWRPWCRAAATGEPERFPPQGAKKARILRFARAYALIRADGAVLFPPATGYWTARRVDRTTYERMAGRARGRAAATVPGLPLQGSPTAVPGSVRHLFTHIDLTVTLERGATTTDAVGMWVRPDQFGELALPTLTRKLLRHAGLAS